MHPVYQEIIDLVDTSVLDVKFGSTNPRLYHIQKHVKRVKQTMQKNSFLKVANGIWQYMDLYITIENIRYYAGFRFCNGQSINRNCSLYTIKKDIRNFGRLGFMDNALPLEHPLSVRYARMILFYMKKAMEKRNAND